MKKIILLLLVLALKPIYAAQATDSLKQITALTHSLSIQKSKNDTLANSLKAETVKNNCYDCVHEIYWKRKALICLPLILFVFTMAVIMLWLGNRYKLRRALYEDPVTLEVTNPAYRSNDPNSGPQIIKKVYFKPSASRLIAFLSGLTAIIISVSAVTYFFYMYFRTGVEPKFDSLFNILLTLGIGVTPYAVAKVTTAVSPKNQPDQK